MDESDFHSFNSRKKRKCEDDYEGSYASDSSEKKIKRANVIPEKWIEDFSLYAYPFYDQRMDLLIKVISS